LVDELHFLILHVNLFLRAVNAGKSLRNEDQARIHVGYLERRYSENGHPAEAAEFHTPPSTPEKDSTTHRPRQRIPYSYFALFDGHAGTGAAISASNELHCILHVKLPPTLLLF
jgi:protein phosphatase 1H